MNERFLEIAKQARLKFPSETALSPIEEKFAELIVKECAGVDLYWLSEQDRKAVAEKIKQHFGVEE